MTWLLETLVWTGGLIALVLLLRRPVARLFGPQAAYALWLVPMVRLVLPPFVLPAWMAPAEQVVAEAAPVQMVEASFEAPAPLAFEPAAPLVAPQPAPAFDLSAAIYDALPYILLAVWLAGAATFLVLRFRAYYRMRELLLANAASVGEVDGIRLLETPMTPGPIAFGVRDKVIALPEEFLDRTDRAQRDFALAHELAHHRGHDLLVNFLVQPLFAAHWFNPLAWMGWRALRCDQEAACDARVVRSRSRQERASYAEVIAGFATGPRLALAAPMACPVLGDKSIIHRLRSLNMNDPTTRRRTAARFGLVAALLALPLTATISYAEPPVPPAPPAPPAAPEAPAAPLAPVAPLAQQAVTEVEETFDEAMGEAPEDGQERRVIVIKKSGEGAEGGEAEWHEKKVHRIRMVHPDGEKMSEEERARMKAEIAEAMAEMKVELAEAREEHRLAMIELKNGLGDMTTIETRCDSDEPVREKVGKDGKKVMVICKSAIDAQAINGLREARASIAADDDMDAEIKASVLEALDAEIARWKSEG